MEGADFGRPMPESVMDVGDEVEITFKRLDEITEPVQRRNDGPLPPPDTVGTVLNRFERIENEMRKRGLEIISQFLKIGNKVINITK